MLLPLYSLTSSFFLLNTVYPIDTALSFTSDCNDQIEHHASIFMRSKNIWKFHKSFAISWKVVEAAILVLYMILKYKSNLYQKKFISSLLSQIFLLQSEYVHISTINTLLTSYLN